MNLVGANDIVLKDTRKRKVRIPADADGPERVVFAGSPPTLPQAIAKARGSNEPPTQRLVFAGSGTMKPATDEITMLAENPPTGETTQLVDSRGETLTSLTWAAYLAWRKTKCRPYDYTNGPPLATRIATVEPGELVTASNRDRSLQEIDQAILGFIGETAELSELVEAYGLGVFYGEARAKLIDECGDCLFCGAWAMDAWGVNPLYQMDDLELLRVTETDNLAVLAGLIQSSDTKQLPAMPPQYQAVIRVNVLNLLMEALTKSGLLANSFKKLRYQRREQKVDEQVVRVIKTLYVLNQLLILANSSVEEALRANVRKLDARYPNGYQAGQGGGIREGAGK